MLFDLPPVASLIGPASALEQVEAATRVLVLDLLVLLHDEQHRASLTLEQRLRLLHDAEQDGVQIGLLLEQVVHDLEQRLVALVLVRVEVEELRAHDGHRAEGQVVAEQAQVVLVKGRLELAT